jgi:Flp pilus assembly protein TadB
VAGRVTWSDVREANSTDTSADTSEAAPPAVSSGLGRDLALYTLARLALVVVVAVVLVLAGVPLLISVGVGVIAGLPLSMLLLRGLHNRVSAGLAARSAARRAQRARLRAELRGEADDESADEDSQT